MQSIKEKQEKKIIYLAVILFATIVIALFVLSQTFFMEEEISENISIPASSLSIRSININFIVLENAFFDEIQEFEKISYPEIEIGRENPFRIY